MGRNDFFLDSGIIYGYVDLCDKTWHKPCEDHFKKYPRKDHNYCSVRRIVDKEIDTVSKRRKETGYITYKMVGAIKRRENALFYSKEINDVDYINIRKELYSKLYKIIFEFLMKQRADRNQKDRDAHLLTNAFLWEMENKGLRNPHFVTIDYRDIKKNENDLISEAMVCLGTAPCLCFCLVSK